MIIRDLWIDRKTGRVRSGWRAQLFLFAILTLTGVLERAIYSLLPLLMQQPPVYVQNSMPDYLWMVINSIATIPTVIAIGILALRFFEHLPAETLGIPLKGPWGVRLLIGLVVGIVLTASIPFIIQMRLDGKLIWHVLSGDDWLDLLLAALVVCLGAFSTILMFHSYFFQTLLRGSGLWGASLATGVLYALFVANKCPATDYQALALIMLNALLMSVMFGLLYLRSGTLWLPIGLFAGWKLGQVIFGFSINGVESPIRPLALLTTEPVPWMRWFTGGAYGPEGGWIVTIILASAIVTLLFFKFGKSFASRWWEWAELVEHRIPPTPWDLTIGARAYQWKLILREPVE